MTYTNHLRNLTMYGSSVQEGTPSPTNPVPIVNSGRLLDDGTYAYDIRDSGKNLCDYRIAKSTHGIIELKDNTIHYVGKYFITFNIPLSVKGVYVCQCKTHEYSNTGYSPAWRILYTDNTYSDTAYVGKPLTVTKAVNNVLLYVSNSTVVDVDVYDLQIECGSSPTTYTAFKGNTARIISQYPLRKNEELKLYNGKLYKHTSLNKIPFPYFGSSVTIVGVTFTVFNTGEVLLNGVATSNTIFRLTQINSYALAPELPAGTYFLSGCPSGGGVSTYKIAVASYTNDSAHTRTTIAQDMGSGDTFTLSEDTHVDICIAVYKNNSYDNILFTPMLNLGTTAEPFEVYGKVSEVAKPSDDIIKFSDGYVSTKCTYVHSRHTKVFDGTEDIIVDTAKKGYKFYIVGLQQDTEEMCGLCTHCESGDDASSSIRYENESNYAVFRGWASPYPTLDSFKAFLASEYARNCPVTIEYDVVCTEELPVISADPVILMHDVSNLLLDTEIPPTNTVCDYYDNTGSVCLSDFQGTTYAVLLKCNRNAGVLPNVYSARSVPPSVEEGEYKIEHDGKTYKLNVPNLYGNDTLKDSVTLDLLNEKCYVTSQYQKMSISADSVFQDWSNARNVVLTPTVPKLIGDFSLLSCSLSPVCQDLAQDTLKSSYLCASKLDNKMYWCVNYTLLEIYDEDTEYVANLIFQEYLHSISTNRREIVYVLEKPYITYLSATEVASSTVPSLPDDFLNIVEPQPEPVDESTYLVDYLYNKLPSVYREEDSKLGIPLYRYLQSLCVGGFNSVNNYVLNFLKIIDPETCPKEIFPYLYESFGFKYMPDIPIEYHRKFLSNIGALLKRRGTTTSIRYLVSTLTGFDVDLSYQRKYNNLGTCTGRFLNINFHVNSIEEATRVNPSVNVISQFITEQVPFYITPFISAYIDMGEIKASYIHNELLGYSRTSYVLPFTVSTVQDMGATQHYGVIYEEYHKYFIVPNNIEEETN